MCSIASLDAYPGGVLIRSVNLLCWDSVKALRLELKDRGIRVSSILPGAAWSDSWKGVDLPEDRLMQADDVAKTVCVTQLK